MSVPDLAPFSAGLLAYGPVPGIELIPYALGLLAWVGLAILAVLLSPITAVVRRIRGRGKPAALQPANPNPPQPAQDPPAEAKVTRHE